MQVESFTVKVLPPLAILIIGIVILSLVHIMTEDHIRENNRQRFMDMMAAVLPASTASDRRGEILELEEPDLTGSGRTLSVYLQWSGERTDGVSFYPVVARGYSGPVILTVGIDANNTISGVQVIETKETPGIGDQLHQDKSDWLQQFTGVSLDSIRAEDWALREDQGRFDALSGATITSRGVINAVHEAADIYAIHRERFSTTK